MIWLASGLNAALYGGNTGAAKRESGLRALVPGPLPSEQMTLVVESLTVMRDERMIIEGLSFRVAHGAALLLTGPNGVGKTTLLRAIAGLLPAASGTIRLDGQTDEADVGERCHFVGHLNAVKPSLTVWENAAFWAEYLGGRESSVTAALEAFRLADLALIPASYLSSGQRRRLGLARLLVAPRPVWLLDEPAVSLDAASRTLLANAVNHHAGGGGIVVAATHQPLGFAMSHEFRLGTRGGPDGAEQPAGGPLREEGLGGGAW